jgi:hypothetical protein
MWLKMDKPIHLDALVMRYDMLLTCNASYEIMVYGSIFYYGNEILKLKYGLISCNAMRYNMLLTCNAMQCNFLFFMIILQCKMQVMDNFFIGFAFQFCKSTSIFR